MGGGARPFLVGGAIFLVNSDLLVITGNINRFWYKFVRLYFIYVLLLITGNSNFI
jgi:hypothetical protein